MGQIEWNVEKIAFASLVFYIRHEFWPNRKAWDSSTSDSPAAVTVYRYYTSFESLQTRAAILGFRKGLLDKNGNVEKDVARRMGILERERS